MMATAHFTDAELGCKCGCGGLPPQDFQDLLEALRIFHDAPLRISSGYRCPDHNAKVSKTGRAGPHTKGAVDVLVSGERAYELLQDAISLGWTGIGLSQKGPHESRFLHLDRLVDSPRPTVWSY